MILMTDYCTELMSYYEMLVPAACVVSVLLCGASVPPGAGAPAAGGGTAARGGTAGKGPQKGKMPGGKPGSMPGATGGKEILITPTLFIKHFHTTIAEIKFCT